MKWPDYAALEARMLAWKRYGLASKDWHDHDDLNKPVDTARLNELLAAEQALRDLGEL